MPSSRSGVQTLNALERMMTDEEKEAIRGAWAHAIRHPTARGQAPNLERQRVTFGELGIVISLDESEEGRFARISVRTERPPIEHDVVVEQVAQIYLLGRFTPFPVDTVAGKDGQTLHYALDIERYKESRAQDLYAEGHTLLRRLKPNVDPLFGDAEHAAIELGLPIAAMCGAWHRDRVLDGDERACTFLSDRFLVPRRWVDVQVSHYREALAGGDIDEAGRPRR